MISKEGKCLPDVQSICPEPGLRPVSCMCGEDAKELPDPDSWMPRGWAEYAISEAIDPGPVLGDLQRS